MKTLKILFSLIISSLLVSTASAATIDKIEAIDNNTIELTASPDVVFSDVNVEGDVKLLKDLPVSFSVKDSENPKKVLLNLSNDLTANTSYSLISVLGAEGNIDFRINDFIEGEFMNDALMEGENGIEKVNLVDSRTIELYFTNDLTEDVFEFKILSELDTAGLSSEGNNVLKVDILKNLETSTSYIVMVLRLEDVNGNPMSFEDDLYDLTTPETLEQAVQEEEVVVAITEEEAIEAEEVLTETGNIEEVALNSAETPETGTTTSILIMVALLANLGFFFRKKIFS